MKKFVKTVIFVTVFSGFERLLGFLYRIYLSRTLGSVGVGIYQVALTVFATLITFSSSGIPVTVSRLMTKYRAKGEKEKITSVMSAGILLSVATSVVVTAVFLIFKNVFAKFLFTDEKCMTILLIILPTLILTGVYNVLRGILWGNHNFLPYSAIDLLEEVIMIFIGIILINKSADLFSGVKSAGLAVASSYVCSFAMMSLYFVFKKEKFTTPLPTLYPLFTASSPVTLMRSVGSVINTLVAIIFPLMLVKYGYSKQKAMADFGSAFGMAMPLLSVPSTLIGGFTVVLAPEVSENFYKNDLKSLNKYVSDAVTFSTIVTAMFLPLFAVLGEEIGLFVYGDYTCGKFLSVCSPVMITMSLSMITTTVLNSIGEEKKTLLYFTSTSVMLLLCCCLLPKYLGIYSLIVGYAVSFSVSSILNIRLICKKSKQSPKYLLTSLTVILCSLPAVLFGKLLKNLLLRTVSSLVATIIDSVAIMLFMLIIFAVTQPVDVKRLIKSIKRK